MQHPDTTTRQDTEKPVGASFTPGPWIVFVGDGYFDILPAGREGYVAEDIKNTHDADLIAAAPKLLAAVTMLIPAATIAAEMLSRLGCTDDATKILEGVALAEKFKRDAEGRP